MLAKRLDARAGSGLRRALWCYVRTAGICTVGSLLTSFLWGIASSLLEFPLSSDATAVRRFGVVIAGGVLSVWLARRPIRRHTDIPNGPGASPDSGQQGRPLTGAGLDVYVLQSGEKLAKPIGREGRSRVLSVALLLVGSEVLVDLVNISTFGPKELVQLCLAVLIAYFVVQGRRWARWFTVFFALGRGIPYATAGVGMIAVGQLAGGSFLCSLGAIYLSCSALLSFSPAVANYFRADPAHG